MPKYKIEAESAGRTKELGTVEAGGIGHALHEARKQWADPTYKLIAERVGGPGKDKATHGHKEVRVKK